MTGLFVMMLGTLPLFPMLGEPRAAIEEAYPDHRKFVCYSNQNPVQGFNSISITLGDLPAHFEYEADDAPLRDETTYSIDIGYWGCDVHVPSNHWSTLIEKEKAEELQDWLTDYLGSPTRIEKNRVGRSIVWVQGGYELALFYDEGGPVSLIESTDEPLPSEPTKAHDSTSGQGSIGQTCGMVPFWNEKKSIAEIQQLFESAGYRVAMHDRETIEQIPGTLDPENSIVKGATVRLFAYGIDEMQGCSTAPSRVSYFIYFSESGEVLGAYRMEKAIR